MKIRRITILSLLVLGSILLAACGGATGAADDGTMKIVYVITGTLGDKSFIDSANRGLVKAAEEFGYEYVAVEAGTDPAKWEPAFVDTVQDPDVDFVIVGSNDLMEILYSSASDYPEKKFIVFDNVVDFEDECSGCDNIYAIQYKQNEGSFVVGLYAGLMSETGMIGAVGGQELPVIADFFVGYVQGAGVAGITEENVLLQYAGDWGDPAKGKELALTMYQQGADIIFQVAGGTGMGVFQAAEEVGKWAIGVDSDQGMIIEETNPDQAAVILTSMLKNVDNSLYRAFELYEAGNLPFGTNENLGIAEGGVGVAYNKYFDEYTPDDVKKLILEAEASVKSGEIEVVSVF